MYKHIIHQRIGVFLNIYIYLYTVMNPAQKQGKHALMTQAESRGQGADPRVEDFVRVGAIRGDTYILLH